MKSLDVCDSTQNDDDKESGKEAERQKKKANGKNDVSVSPFNGRCEGSKNVKKAHPGKDNGRSKCLETRTKNDFIGSDRGNNGLENSSGETDETTPTSTGEGRLHVLSRARLNSSETKSRKERMDTRQVSQELRDESMDVDSASAREHPYKNGKRLVETDSFDCFKEDSAGDNDIVDKDNQSMRSFEMDEETIFYSDCDKGNETNGEVDAFSKTDKVSLEGSSSGCDIQVSECQTIFGADKDFLWSENEWKKSQDSEDYPVSPALNESDRNPHSNLESTLEKEADDCSEEVEVVIELDDENEKEVVSTITKSAASKTTEIVSDESYSSKTHNDYEDGKSLTSPQVESVSSRKRKRSNEDELVAKTKKKKSGFVDVGRNSVSRGKSTNVSSPNKIPSSLDTEPTTSAADQCETERTNNEQACVDDINSEISETSNLNTKGPSTKESAPSEFLANLRGTLKNLTRSDLEELIVQKLCEVVTERSNVGELRRKAQALEEDQQRWRNKVQNLTKQMREMEMVMKKYMCEVQKQVKENPAQMVTPIKVTRSVGLQVSFYSSSSKQPKPNVSPSTSSPAQNANAKNAKAVATKPLTNPTSVPSPRNKLAPSPQKPPAQPTKTPPSQSKKTVTTRSDSGSLHPKGAVPSLTNTNRVVQGQLPGSGIKINYKPLSPVHLLQQNGAKIIDLTEDDDKEEPTSIGTSAGTSTGISAGTSFGSCVGISAGTSAGTSAATTVGTSAATTVGTSVGKPQSPIRVINHLPQQVQVQAQTNGMFSYILPKTSSSGIGTSSSTQNRQVLIQAPTLPQQNKTLVCQMPPLLFKGGSAGPLPGPGPQIQTQNVNNRIILTKAVRHPAPLPEYPAPLPEHPAPLPEDSDMFPEHPDTLPQPTASPVTEQNMQLLPPRPALKISKVQTGIVLSWNMALSPEHAPISSYQLYAYQESNSPPTSSLWKKVGDVKALPLPMACTLTQFMSGHKYHFAVRAVDNHCRQGPFSFPGTIVLVK